MCSVPSMAPGELRVSRSPDGLSMNISWSPLTLSQARGFVDYIITYGPVGDINKQLEIMTNITYVMATSLDAMATYFVMVRGQTSKGPGPSSAPVTSPSPVTGEVANHTQPLPLYHCMLSPSPSTTACRAPPPLPLHVEPLPLYHCM